MKRLILADRQAWLNYAITCAIKLAKGEVERPPIDDYQAYGWAIWLQEANTYGKMCIDEGRLLSYKEYSYAYTGANRFMLTKETVEEVQEGVKELNRQYNGNLLSKDWDEYGETLKGGYYETEQLF